MEEHQGEAKEQMALSAAVVVDALAPALALLKLEPPVGKELIFIMLAPPARDRPHPDRERIG